MRAQLIAGNWKMNTTSAVARELAESIARRAVLPAKLIVALCPPFPYLSLVKQAIQHSPVALGAQDLHHESGGAFTGEISGSMLVDVGCRYCIVGHSERRHLLGESDALIRRKVRAALDVALTPIVCVGELLEEREADQTRDVITAQVTSAIAGLSSGDAARLVFAYEPVWAIGTGRNATPEQAEEVHSQIRKILAERYNASLGAETVILYGGSVKAGNARSLLAQPNVDGALVGGSSLAADEFLKIIEAGAAVAQTRR